MTNKLSILPDKKTGTKPGMTNCQSVEATSHKKKRYYNSVVNIYNILKSNKKTQYVGSKL